MSVWDGRILEIASQDEDGVVTVGALDDSDYILVSNSQISDRCKKLADHGLLRKVSRGTYVITEEGRAYLRGEYDAEAGVFVNQDESDSIGESASGASNGSNGTT